MIVLLSCYFFLLVLLLFIARIKLSFSTFCVAISFILAGFLSCGFYCLIPVKLVLFSPLIIFVAIPTAYFLFLRKKLRQIRHKDGENSHNGRKLSTNLIPRSCWGKNARTIEPYKSSWESISKFMLKKTSKCEICSKIKKPNDMFECHEEWIFDLENNIQKLKKVMVLCRMCHKVKHIGKTMRSDSGTGNAYLTAKKHMSIVNNWSKEEVENHITDSLKQINLLNEVDSWSRDITYLDIFGGNK